MFITNKALSRRTILRGAGAALALPVLEAMVPVFGARAAGTPVRRFGAVFVPLGERPGFWEPAQTGASFELAPIMKPLEKWQSHMTVVSQLCDPLDGHATTVAAWLSGAIPKRTLAENVHAGVTVDQVIADQIGQDTPMRSLELATEDFTGWIGGCDPSYSCAYMNTISWKSATTPMPMEINPRSVFERMFGRPGTVAQRKARMATDRSVLDSLLDELGALKRGLNGPDANRLNDYTENVREIEQRIQKAEQQSATNVEVPDAPVGIPEDFEDHAALMYDLMALAYEADLTRVVTYMKSRDASQRVYPKIGVTEPHHAMSHHGNNPEKLANLVKVNTHHMALFARFVDKLASTPDGDGSLLDHSLILYGSGMSESDTHSRINIPTLLVGKGAGLVKGHQHVAAPKETPMANFLLDLANKFGSTQTTFGISTKRLEV
jgi:uncharacterized protein DUF1552